MTDAAGRRLQRGVMAPVPERAIAVREAAPALRRSQLLRKHSDPAA